MKSDLNINPDDYTAHKSHGKFEGEPSGATEYFWEQMLEGDGETIFHETEDVSAEIFHITEDEAEVFDLNIGECFLLWEDSQGFVYGLTYPTQEAAIAAFNAQF